MSLVSFNREGLPSALSLNFTIYEKGHPLFKMCFHKLVDCVKSVQIRSFFWSVFFRIGTEYGQIGTYLSTFSPNAGKYGPETTPYLDTFHALVVFQSPFYLLSYSHCLTKMKMISLSCRTIQPTFSEKNSSIWLIYVLIFTELLPMKFLFDN